MKVFLAFSFRPQDRDLVGQVEQMIVSHCRTRPATGENLGGEQLTPAVQDRIDKCDALIAVLTRRDAKQAGGYTTHQWVLDELGYARNNKKMAIAIVEDGVDVGGMFQPHEYIPLDPAQPLAAFLRLSETLSLWKTEKGRTVKVQILPPEFVAKIGAGASGGVCEYRLWNQGKYGTWIEATPVPEGAAGTFVYVDGVQDEHLIQIQFRVKAKVLQSPATSQWLQVAFKTGGGR
jgi:hypothetical protein